MSQPLVSIVTPSFEQGHFIEEAIASVAAQDYPRVEHIVVDGGSLDGTLAVLARHPHLRWISEPDDGQADALRKGFGMAQGEVLAWLNADDLYLPGALSAAVEALEERGCGLVHGGWLLIDEQGATVSTVPVKKLDLARLLDGVNMVAQPAAFFTRAAYDAVGGVDARYHYAMDYDLWIKLAKRYAVREIDAPLAAFRVHGDAKSSALADRFWPEVRRISRRHGGRRFPPGYVEHLCTQHPWLWRARMAYRLLASGELRELWSRARAKLSGSS